jgi:hypothetical protein
MPIALNIPKVSRFCEGALSKMKAKYTKKQIILCVMKAHLKFLANLISSLL